MPELKIESKGMFAAFLFYAVAGILFLAALPTANFPPQLAVIGMFSLAAAYGILRKRSWAFWLVIILFFTSTTFAAYMAYYVAANDLLLGVGMIAYLLLTWVSTVYVAVQRKSLGI